MFKVLLVAALCTMVMPAQASDRIYLDETEMQVKDGRIYVHTGHNVWIQYKSVKRDCTGLYSRPCHILKDSHNLEQKMWKCPYCYHHWPVKTACQNPDCPSLYM